MQRLVNDQIRLSILSNDRVEESEILSNHFDQTAQRVEATDGPVLILHDTTEFAYHRRKPEDSGIIFKQAITHHIKNNPGQLLDKNSVVFHAGGNNKKLTDKLLVKVGIKKAAPDRDNPFDLVPNLAGGNNLGFSAVGRSLAFWKKVKGSEASNPVESPHTLPFISLEAYHRFLTLAGDMRSADRVRKYMDKINELV